MDGCFFFKKKREKEEHQNEIHASIWPSCLAYELNAKRKIPTHLFFFLFFYFSRKYFPSKVLLDSFYYMAPNKQRNPWRHHNNQSLNMSQHYYAINKRTLCWCWLLLGNELMNGLTESSYCCYHYRWSFKKEVTKLSGQQEKRPAPTRLVDQQIYRRPVVFDGAENVKETPTTNQTKPQKHRGRIHKTPHKTTGIVS